jgi:hypothetical protein
MKHSAQKSNTLSLVPTDPRPYDSGLESKSAALRESFDSWLNSVAPTLVQTSTAQAPRNVADRWRSSLTSRDITRVNRATVRESNDHRHWPPEVVMSFLAAEVIKRK